MSGSRRSVVLAEQQEAAEREKKARAAVRQTVEAMARTGEIAAESDKQIVRSAAEGVQRVATAPINTGSMLWDSMFDMWSSAVRSLRRPTHKRPTIRAGGGGHPARRGDPDRRQANGNQRHHHRAPVRRRDAWVQQQVSLYDEKVIVERRKPVKEAATGETLTEVTIEMIETAEVPVVGKSLNVREEIVVRRERTQRVETVRDTVRRDEIEVTHSSEKRRALASSRK